MKKPKKLPQKIYVTWDEDGEWLSASLTPKGIENGTQVGIYELDSAKVQKITEELV